MSDTQYVCVRGLPFDGVTDADPEGETCRCLEEPERDGAEFECECVPVYAATVTCNGCGRELVRINVDTGERA